MFVLIFYSQNVFSQICCNTTIPVTISYSQAAFSSYSTRVSNSTCTPIPFTNSAQPCNGGCSIPTVGTNSDLLCYSLTITIEAPGCPNYPKRFTWDMDASCPLEVQMPVGGPITVTYRYTEACSSCNVVTQTGVGREIFKDVRAYNLSTNAVGSNECCLIFSYVGTTNIGC